MAPNPAAAEAAAPPEEPPGDMDKFQGLRVRPYSGLSVVKRMDISGVGQNPLKAVAVFGGGYDQVHDTPAFNPAPDGTRARSHDGLRSTPPPDQPRCRLIPFLIAVKPASVRYFAPLLTIGMPRNFCSASLICPDWVA